MKKTDGSPERNIYERNEKKLRYIKNDYIERKAYTLARAIDSRWPREAKAVGIDRAIYYLEKWANLQFLPEDLKRKFPEINVAGLYDVCKNKIEIEKELYRATNAINIRMGFFTMAHEIGHFILHGQRVRKEIVQSELFGEEAHCKGEKMFLTLKDTIEEPFMDLRSTLDRQANYFAGCFLMPAEAIKKEMAKVGIMEVVIADDWVHDERSMIKYIMNFVKRTGINEKFDVNISPMAYRLKRLGWFKKEL